MLVIRVYVRCPFNAIDRVDICKSFANRNNITKNMVQSITYKFQRNLDQTRKLFDLSLILWRV